MGERMDVLWADETLRLLPPGAIWWASAKTLIVADVHVDKASTFRQAGLAVPELAGEGDLSKLGQLLNQTLADRLVVLGDLFHHPSGLGAVVRQRLTKFRQRFASLECWLIQGNHDRVGPEVLAEFQFVQRRPGTIDGPLRYWHFPPAEASDQPRGEGSDLENGGLLDLAGHLHPAIRLQGPGKDRLRLPCYWHRGQQLILPAFGSFTGCAEIKPRPGDAVYVVGPDGVLPIKTSTSARHRRRARR